jgi:hypothetical protein
VNKHLYIFSYQTPKQTGVSAREGYAEEASAALFIEAEVAEQALAWGREVSEEYVRRLFPGQTHSWKTLGYAHWIEPEPAQEYPAEVLARLPTVPCGTFPDFEAFRR